MQALALPIFSHISGGAAVWVGLVRSAAAAADLTQRGQHQPVSAVLQRAAGAHHARGGGVSSRVAFNGHQLLQVLESHHGAGLDEPLRCCAAQRKEKQQELRLREPQPHIDI